MDDIELQPESPQSIVPSVDSAFVPPPASRRFSELTLEIVRPLTPDDLLDAAESGVDVSGPTSLAAIRHQHHRIAMMLVEGHRPAHISFTLGYSPAYVTRLQADPMFQELLAYYSEQRAAAHVDVMDRLKTLSLGAIEELQSRIETEPTKWTKKELMEVAKLGAVEAPVAGAKAGAIGGGMGSGAPSIAINVQFVPVTPTEPSPMTPSIESTSHRVIPPEQEV